MDSGESQHFQHVNKWAVKLSARRQVGRDAKEVWEPPLQITTNRKFWQPAQIVRQNTCSKSFSTNRNLIQCSSCKRSNSAQEQIESWKRVLTMDLTCGPIRAKVFRVIFRVATIRYNMLHEGHYPIDKKPQEQRLIHELTLPNQTTCIQWGISREAEASDMLWRAHASLKPCIPATDSISIVATTFIFSVIN